MFFIRGNTLCNELMHRHHVSLNMIFNLCYVSSSICCIKTFGLISVQFTGIEQLHIPYTFTKICANWMSASYWFLCLKSVHCFYLHRFVDKRTRWPKLFREWFWDSDANRHEICTRLRQRVEITVSRIVPESVKFQSAKLTKMFKLNFENNYVHRL